MTTAETTKPVELVLREEFYRRLAWSRAALSLARAKNASAWPEQPQRQIMSYAEVLAWLLDPSRLGEALSLEEYLGRTPAPDLRLLRLPIDLDSLPKSDSKISPAKIFVSGRTEPVKVVYTWGGTPWIDLKPGEAMALTEGEIILPGAPPRAVEVRVCFEDEVISETSVKVLRDKIQAARARKDARDATTMDEAMRVCFDLDLKPLPLAHGHSRYCARMGDPGYIYPAFKMVIIDRLLRRDQLGQVFRVVWFASPEEANTCNYEAQAERQRILQLRLDAQKDPGCLDLALQETFRLKIEVANLRAEDYPWLTNAQWLVLKRMWDEEPEKSKDLATITYWNEDTADFIARIKARASVPAADWRALLDEVEAFHSRLASVEDRRDYGYSEALELLAELRQKIQLRQLDARQMLEGEKPALLKLLARPKQDHPFAAFVAGEMGFDENED